MLYYIFSIIGLCVSKIEILWFSYLKTLAGRNMLGPPLKENFYSFSTATLYKTAAFWFFNFLEVTKIAVVSLKSFELHVITCNSCHVICFEVSVWTFFSLQKFIFTLREKCPHTEFFLVCIFPYSDWIRRDTPYLSVFSPNTGKYGPEKTPYLDICHAVSFPDKLISKYIAWSIFTFLFLLHLCFF